MNDFSVLMAAELHRRADSAQVDPEQATVTVRAGIRRRRAARSAASVGIAVVLVGVVAVGSYGAYSRYQVEPAIVVTQSPTMAPTEAASPTPQETVSPSPSAEPDTATTEYPPPAASRGDGFPAAYEMRDWVWDQVGTGWSLETYSLRSDPYLDPMPTIPSAVIYLVEPSGARFELQALDSDHSAGLRVVSWQEGAKTAHIMWEGDYWTVPTPGSAVLDLVTGAIDPIVFKTPWGNSESVGPMAVTAAGNELWSAIVGSHVRYYRYGGGDNWTVASVNDLDSLDTLDAAIRWMEADFGPWGPRSTRPDGGAVLFELRAENPPYFAHAPTQIAVYDVDADKYAKATVGLVPGDVDGASCELSEWTDDGALTNACSSQPDPLYYQTVSVPTVPDLGPTPPALGDERATGVVVESARIGYDEAPDQRTLWYACSC